MPLLWEREPSQTVLNLHRPPYDNRTPLIRGQGLRREAAVAAHVGRRIGVLPGGITTVNAQCSVRRRSVPPSVSSGDPARVDDPTIPSRAHDPGRLSATRALPVALNERPVVGPDRPLALRPCLVIAGTPRAGGGGVRHPPTGSAPGWRS